GHGASTEKSAYGPTKNPHDLERVPGGSSGGSAASVAADMSVWALGTDTGGSIRQPSAFCGTVGVKPTYGRVSRYGAIAMGSSLDQVGPITKTVEDAAIILSIIAGEDKMDATSAKSGSKDYTKYLTGEVKGLKIGIDKEILNSLNEKIKHSIEVVLKKYEKLGAKIKDIKLPNAKYALPAYYIIMPSEISSNLARYDGVKYGMRALDHKNTELDIDPVNRSLLENYLDSRKYGLGSEVKKRIMLGTYALSSGYYDAYYLRAQKVRTIIKRELEKTLNEVDLILMPTTPGLAFKIGEKTEDPLEMYLEDIFTVMANITGIPAISVPCGKIDWENKKLPVGFQLMGKWFDEENMLRAAHAFEVS
ncbi:MAG TPA: Asp-tRNA(Asn)/Glu-tRNA(Gln) amidotransferase subunit GatA, partial [Candidatus Moranbacteria bacterium]|nr:Asp-tRNA(Asn)/Glu-tRNA(Gln) amidotransferase subunit GatA [Candidatus Moranbacteria bacterium]